MVIDDYAHHPTEIMATLSAARNYPHKKLWCIFQPHTYSRTIKLLDEFSHSFGDADELILADIYAAREKDTGEVNSKLLCEMILNNNVSARYLDSFKDIEEYVKKSTSPGDVVITMVAGDVYKIGEDLLKY
jgi:UDP-N-acetylmuramate--alanine ligase